MDILFKVMHKIDYETQQYEKRNMPEHFNNYVKRVISEACTNRNIREYKVGDRDGDVITNIKLIAQKFKEEQFQEDTINVYCDNIAQKLLDTEIECQEYRESRNLPGQLLKGSLLQALVYDEEKKIHQMLLAKVESSEWFDDSDYEIKTGFPKNGHKIWKTCVIDLNIEENIDISRIVVYVDNGAKYWAKDFIQIVETQSDQKNTELAFKYLDQILQKKIKKVSPSDHMVLRNSLIRYFRSEKFIDYYEMIQDIFIDYTPQLIEKDTYNNIIEQLGQLPEKRGFDCQFTSVPKVIKARIKSVFKVTNEIQLTINDSLEGEVSDYIESFTDRETGQQYIKIKTDDQQTYETFIKKQR